MTVPLEPEIEQLRNENQELKEKLATLQSKLNITDHLLNNSDTLAWMVNTELKFTFLSESLVKEYLSTTGIKPELGKKSLDFFSDESRLIWTGRFERALSGESFHIEELTGKADDNKYFNLYISPIRINRQITGVQVHIAEITGLKKAEENELANLEILRRISSQVQDLYYEVNMEGEITELSPAIENLSGYNREELIGKDIGVLYRKEADRKRLLNIIKQKGIVRNHVVELIDKDGSLRNMSINATLICDEQGKPEKIAGIIRDITEIEKKNKDLRWLRRAIEHTPLSFIITDVEGNIEYTNPFFTKKTGYTQEEVLNKKPSILKSGKHEDFYYRKMWQTILSGNVWEGEFQNKRKNGSLFTERTIISPVKDDDGKIVNFIAIKEDIAEAKKAMDEIKRLKSFNDRIINTMREGIVVENADGEILFTNPSFSAMTGYSISELIGCQWNKVIDEKSRMDMLLESTGQTGTLNESVESGLKCKDGSCMPVIMSGSLIQDGRKNMGLISVFTDITYIKENERKLKEALEKAQLSDKLKSSFLANVSHEIRTPMNAILGFAEILRQERNLDEETRDEYFSFIEQKGTELLQVISDVIEISKIEAKMVTIYKQIIVVNTLIEKTFNIFKEKFQAHENHAVKFSKIIPPDSDSIVIENDANRLSQVFLNLLHNAGKFTSEGEISIGYTIHDHHLEFFVKDTGIGISPENQKIIFDRFRQADNNYTRQYGGTGLGLSICQNLMKMMDGDIRVESEVNEGATFYLTLPR